MKTDKDNTVYSVTKRIILQLDSQNRRDTAILAALRNSAGKDLSEAAGVWPFLFENLPAAFLSVSGKPTCEENAIISTLQIYALCRQGTNQTVKADCSFDGSLGRSLSAGRDEESEKAMDRRFNAMITADTFDGFVYYLRQLVKQVSAKNGMVINFAKLADDLYWYQRGNSRKICFRWATEYYGHRERSKEVQEG